jgi:hypothetical protein
MRSASSPHRATRAASRSEVLLLRVCVGGRRAGLVVDVVKRDACVAIETVQGARASRRWPVLRHDSSVRTNLFARRYVPVRDLVPLVPLPPISDLTHGEEASPPYTLASRCRPTSRRPSRTFGTGWSRSLDHAWPRASRPKRSSGNPPTTHNRHAFPGPQPRRQRTPHGAARAPASEVSSCELLSTRSTACSPRRAHQRMRRSRSPRASRQLDEPQRTGSTPSCSKAKNRGAPYFGTPRSFLVGRHGLEPWTR